MTRVDVATVFGEEYAERTFGPVDKPSTRKRKARNPYAPQKPSVRAEPWSELKKPVALPSFTP